MAINIYNSDINVLLLFNLDPSWSKHEKAEVYDVTSEFGNAISKTGVKTCLVPVTTNHLDSILSNYDPVNNIIFNWCESLPGVNHSEHNVVEYLEKHNFTFTGASSATIELAQDKCRIKQLLYISGVLTPRWEIYSDTSNISWNRFPAIVKPSIEHCSEGIDRNAVVNSKAELNRRICYVIDQYCQPAIVEDFIDGRELHVSLWGDGTINMLPPAEMEFSFFSDEHDRICTYEAKFVPASNPYQNIKTILPAPLNNDELFYIEQVCRDAYTIAGCRDYARIDMRIKDGLFYIIDVNPNCDISPDTSTIAAAELAGYTYGEFGERIIRLAEQRHPLLQELYYHTDILT